MDLTLQLSSSLSACMFRHSKIFIILKRTCQQYERKEENHSLPSISFVTSSVVVNKYFLRRRMEMPQSSTNAMEKTIFLRNDLKLKLFFHHQLFHVLNFKGLLNCCTMHMSRTRTEPNISFLFYSVMFPLSCFPP